MTGRPSSCSCGTCGKCKHREYMREWYAKKTPEERRAHMARRDPERVRADDRARAKTPKRIAHATANTKRWREKHPEKTAAQRKVAYAIRQGRLTKEPCLACDREDVHAHHHDYAKPLDVTWLCPIHHRLAHRYDPS